MSEEKSKLELIGEIAEANNKNLELIEEINKLESVLDEIREYINDDTTFDGSAMVYNDLLQILDKVKE